jgi:hypothetical protein
MDLKAAARAGTDRADGSMVLTCSGSLTGLCFVGVARVVPALQEEQAEGQRQSVGWDEITDPRGLSPGSPSTVQTLST